MILSQSLSARRVMAGVVMAATAFSTLFAQYRVTATVNGPEGEPEDFCTYRIFAPGDSIRPIVGNVADANGVINADLPAAGDYTMTVTAAMRLPLSVSFTVSPSEPVADLGFLSTAFAGEQLNEVTITAQRPLVSKDIDRIGYEVAADPEASTSNLREILRKVPMVTVEDDGTIKVNGSSNFKIYKNGRPNNAFTKNAKDIFAAIPASTIKKIEVITDPGAREDAESSGVILNIVTSSTAKMTGVSGSVGLNWDTNKPYPTPNAFIMTQIDKLTLSASGGYFKYGRRDAEGEQTTSTVYDSTLDRLDRTEHFTANGQGSFFNLEGSLELDTMNLFTTALNGFIVKSGYDVNGNIFMTRADGTPVYSYNSFSFYPINGYTDIDFNFDYQRSTRRKDETITLSYRLSHTNQKEEQETEYSNLVNTPFLYTGINSDYDLKFFEHTFQVDWSRPYGKHYKLDTGAKYILRSSHSNNHQELVGIPEGSTENEFEHRYHIFGIYADARATYGKLTARAGLRYEYSRLGAEFMRGPGEDFHTNLNDFVPNLSMAWNVSESSMLKASYSRRIQRPGISYLNPAITVGPTYVSYGNPDLESMAINSAVLNYSLFKRKFNLDLSATFTATNNGVGEIEWTDDDNILHTTYENFTHRRGFQLSGFFQWQITDKTSWMFNGSLGWDRYSVKSNTEDVSLARVSGNIYTRVSQNLPWDLNLSLSMFYWSGGIGSAYNYYSMPLSSLNYNVTLKRSFLKNKSLDVSLTVRNLGKPTSQNKSYGLNNGLTLESTSKHFHRATFSIALNWRFGSLRAQVKKTAATINNDDLTGRKSESAGGSGQGN